MGAAAPQFPCKKSIEGLPACGQPLLQDAYREHVQRRRALRQVGRRIQIDEPGPQLELDSFASLALPRAPAGLDVDRLPGHDVKSGRVRELVCGQSAASSAALAKASVQPLLSSPRRRAHRRLLWGRGGGVNS